jgi:hypothetical protein
LPQSSGTRELKSISELSEFGTNISGDHVTGSFLVMYEEDKVIIQKVEQLEGGYKFFVNQGSNVDSITLWPGGLYSDSFLIAGEIATISNSVSRIFMIMLYRRKTMGLTLEFLLGNDKKIIKAAKKLDYDLFDEPSCILKKADFSLHISPKDLNTLSLAASKYNNHTPLDLREQLILIVNKADHGLFGINNRWVEYFSQVSQNDSDNLTQVWFNEMQKQYPNEKIEVTKEGINAVKDLSELCKYAINNRKEVYHFWVG